MLIFAIIIFFLLTGLVFALLLLLTKIIRTGSKKHVGTIESRKNQKLSILFISFLIAGLTTYFFLFTSPSSNYKTAYIETEKQGGFKVIVKGKRLYMVHDPISLFLRKTYEDSMQYMIPRNEGVIKGEELPSEKGYYKSVGTIAIQNDKMEINLAANNYDDKKLDPDTWNGKYKLVWRKH